MIVREMTIEIWNRIDYEDIWEFFLRITTFRVNIGRQEMNVKHAKAKHIIWIHKILCIFYN